MLCPKCQGKGMCRVQKTCRTCISSGKGHTWRERGFEQSPARVEVRCKACDGQGFRWGEEGCSQCERTGQVKEVMKSIRCMHCRGAKTIQVQVDVYPSGLPKLRSEACSQCGGTGWVTAKGLVPDFD
jgi:DnaJ-class molecular chaperone